MEERLKLRYPVIVEGKYDKAKVASVVSTPIITLDGFGIFKNTEKKELLKRLCAENGVIVLTDSDSAGNFIRSRLKGFLKGEIFNVYTSRRYGKEKRKDHYSAEGVLGVEGTPESELYALLLPFAGGKLPKGAGITKTDMYAAGLSGGSGSAAKRALLAEALGLPGNLGANALLEAINLSVSAEEFKNALDRINTV